MPNFDEILNDILENDKQESDAVVDEPENAESEEEKERGYSETEPERNTYDNGGLETRVSNSVGRGAVENVIKQSVYQKYNIDANAMKEYSRLSPTEMISSFSDSVRELGVLRDEYRAGNISKAEYQVANSKLKGEISGKMLEMGSSGKSILEDILLRSFGVSPADVSKVRTFGDLVDLFRHDTETDRDAESRMDSEPFSDYETEFYDGDNTPDTEQQELQENDADIEAEAQAEADLEPDKVAEESEADTDKDKESDTEKEQDKEQGDKDNLPEENDAAEEQSDLEDIEDVVEHPVENPEDNDDPEPETDDTEPETEEEAEDENDSEDAENEDDEEAEEYMDDESEDDDSPANFQAGFPVSPSVPVKRRKNGKDEYDGPGERMVP